MNGSINRHSRSSFDGKRLNFARMTSSVKSDGFDLVSTDPPFRDSRELRGARGQTPELPTNVLSGRRQEPAPRRSVGPATSTGPQRACASRPDEAKL